MFSYIIITLFLFGTTLGQRFPICAENEEYLDCGTSCQRTCMELFEPRECSDVCVKGCFCKDGFVRAGESGACVPITTCKNVPKCGTNEIYTQCAPLCAPTCQNSHDKLCADICLEGCVCEEGYVRNIAGGRCVPKDSCNLEICKVNQVYKDCGSLCPGTCEQPQRVCGRRCVSGCFCLEGYVLNSETQECVKLEDCPNSFL